VLALYWYNKDYPGNILFDKYFQEGLDSAQLGPVEYYHEYLESNRFPGEKQSLLLRDYLKNKYADKEIDVVVAVSDPPLDFLLKYRAELFPNTPIVFVAVKLPTKEQLEAGPGITGILPANTHKEIIDLALRLHPDTQEVFVISGTLERDKRWETPAREVLQRYESKLKITYLTDLPLNQLIATAGGLPKRSIALWLWEQSQNDQSQIFESADTLGLISPSTPVPIYGMSSSNIGRGIVGGFVHGSDTNATKVAEVVVRILKGERAQDITVENAPFVPMFDWRELQRWGINESSLPVGSIIRFKEPSYWEQNRWRIIGVASLLLLQSFGIVLLLFERRRRRESDANYHSIFNSVNDAIFVYDIDSRAILEANSVICAMYGWSAEEFMRLSIRDVSSNEPPYTEEAALDWLRKAIGGDPQVFEWRARSNAGRLFWVEVSLRRAVIKGKDRVFGVVRDITERKEAERALRESEERTRDIQRALPDLIFLQTAEGVFIDYHANNSDELFIGPEQFLGKNIAEVLPPELTSQFLPAFRRAQETGEVQVIEYSLPFQGEALWFEARIINSRDHVLSVVRNITDRKRAEEALRENRTQLAGVIESAMDAIISINEEQRIVLMNPAAEQMFGCSARECIGKPLDLLIPEKFREEHQTHLESFGQTSVTTRSMGALGDLYGQRLDGAQFPIEASISQVELSGRKFYTAIIRDMTSRKQSEEALREAQESLTIALEAAQMGTWDLDLTRDFSGHRSLRHDQIFGYETQQKNWGREIARRHIVEEDCEIFDEAFARAVVTGKLDFEARVRWPDDSVHWMAARGRLYPDESGIPVRGAGVNFDITEHKLAEEALRESEERFRTMADTAPVMIWMSGTDRQYTYVNHQWLVFTGRSIQEELGEGWIECVHPDDVNECLEVYDNAFDHQHPFVRGYRLRRADGEFRWIYCSGTPRFSPSGNFLGFIGSCLDITERKEGEQALADLSGQLIRAREEECARIARELHDDLSQGMALVSIGLEQLRLKPPATPAELRTRLEVILNQIGELAKETHRMAYDLHPSKLTQLGLVLTVSSLCHDLESRHGIKIAFDHEDMPTTLNIDLSLCLYRIVQECLNNVIKHSGAQEARIDLRATEKEIWLRVSDSGMGFDAESPELKKGLGLLGMRERLRLVGGTIVIKSLKSRGTQIDARVPFSAINLQQNGNATRHQTRSTTH
jgi:PAS domain S-box-containing protein